MKVVNGALVRQQNENDIDDSCFDTSEVYFQLRSIKSSKVLALDLAQFIDNRGVLQRHPNTKFPNDISSDHAHMYLLATGKYECSTNTSENKLWPLLRNTQGHFVSVGLKAAIERRKWLSDLALFSQWLVFFIPVRWNDGKGSAKIQFGYRHHCGDYRLFKCLLRDSWVRYLVRKSTLKKMSRYYWFGDDWPENPDARKEPSSDWLITIDDNYVEECL